jgi:flagellar capping protein FliD
MSTIKGSSLRIGGLNSGLDTEAIVNAMTASTKLRITTNQRQVLKLEAQQEAYRSIIGKFNSFRDKYFDRLNQRTFLGSRGTFTRHSASIFTNVNNVRTEGTPPGVRVSTSANAIAGTYDVTVKQVAKQASLQSKAVDATTSSIQQSVWNSYILDMTDGSTTLTAQERRDVLEGLGITITSTTDLSTAARTEAFVNSISNETLRDTARAALAQELDDKFLGDVPTQKVWAMNVTVGGNTRMITFSGENQTALIDSMNASLRTAFGSRNAPNQNEGIVSVRVNSDNNIVFSSADNRAISAGTAAELQDIVNFGNMNNWVSGNNSITLVIDGHIREVSFPTVAPDYFDSIRFENVNGVWHIIGTSAQQQNDLNNILIEIFDKERLDAYNEWKLPATGYVENFNRINMSQAQRVQALERAGFSFAGMNTAEQLAEINRLTQDGTTATNAERTAARNALTAAITQKELNIRAQALYDYNVANPGTFDLAAMGITTTNLMNGFDVNVTNATAFNTFINAAANSNARELGNTAMLNYMLNLNADGTTHAGREHQMTAAQRALFIEEADRRDAATRASEFERAMTDVYNLFDTWQRTQAGSNSSFLAGGVRNPNYIFKDEFMTMLGLDSKTVNDTDWKDFLAGIDANELITRVNDLRTTQVNVFNSTTPPPATPATVSLLTANAATTTLVDNLNKRFEDREKWANDGQVDRLGFLRNGIYSEHTAFFTSYANDAGVITGTFNGIAARSFNTFLETEVIGTVTPLTDAQRVTALRNAGFDIAVGSNAAQINAFLGTLTNTASDATRYNAAVLARRTAIVDDGTGGKYTGAIEDGRGLTTVERIAALQAAGINTSGITSGYNHGDITTFIGNLSAEDQTKANTALTNARNAKIANTPLSPSDINTILNNLSANNTNISLSEAERRTVLINAGFDEADIDAAADVNAFLATLTGDDVNRAQIAENNARAARISTTADLTKANNAISIAQRDQINTDNLADQQDKFREFARQFNENAINHRLGTAAFPDGTRVSATINSNDELELRAFTVNADGTHNYKPLGAFANPGSANGSQFGLNVPPTTPPVNNITTSTRLDQLGLTPNAQGNYTFEINGVNFSFAANTTVNTMMNTINANQTANVTMTFSTITNQFEIVSKDFGSNAEIRLGANDPQGLLAKLGFEPGTVSERGSNMELDVRVNGVLQNIEVDSNSFTINGTTISIDQSAQVGTNFVVEVRRDTSQLESIIRDFVDDYNALIDYVFGYVNQKADRDYYFLTDTDREELGLSETQEKRWDERARQGLLQNDRTLTRIMADMRTTMFTGMDRGDGTMFGLFSMGITTHSNWRQNGKLVIDENRLRQAIENDIETITEFFTRAETGLMPRLQGVIDSAVSPRGHRWEQGLLVQRAGLANTGSERNNAIYDQIKRINDTIGRLELRYQRQQDRFWKIFSALEQQMGVLHSQGDSISHLIGSMMPQR